MLIFQKNAIQQSVRITAVVVFSLASANAQQPQQAIAFGKSPATRTLDAANQVSPAERSPDALVRADYREFASSKVAQSSEPEGFRLEFHAATTLGAVSANNDFHVTGGTCIEGHQYASGDVCYVDVTFTPQGPGHRTGKLSVVHSASPTPLLAPLGGTGYAPAVSFIPSRIDAVPGTYTSGGTVQGSLLSPGGLAIDGGDSLYIADTGNNLIKFRDSSGAITTLVGGGSTSAVGYSGFGSGIKLNGPMGIAVDYSGTFYIADTGDDVVLVRYIDGIINNRLGDGSTTSCPYSSPCGPSATKIPPPSDLATDPSGNLYVSSKVGGSLPGFSIGENDVSSVSQEYYALGTTAYNYYSTSPSIAVDAYGNLDYTYEDPGGPLLSPTPLCYILAQNRAYSTGAAGQRFWTIAGSGLCGFSGDGGKADGAEISTSIGQFAYDAVGNFYFADTGNNRIRRVDVNTGIIRTIAGNGATGFGGDYGPSTAARIQAPVGLAVDSNGLVYATGVLATGSPSPTPTILRRFGTTGQLLFATQATSTHSLAQTVLVSNVGNDTLNFTHVGLSSGATSDFAIDPNTTSCNFTVPLDSGNSCNIGFIFTPTAVGTRSAVVSLLDDSVSGLQTINLVGVGATTVTLTPAPLPFGSLQEGVSSTAKTATLKNTGSAVLTISKIAITGAGASSYSMTKTCGATLAVGASCTISVTFKPAAIGSLPASLVVSDNAVTTSQTAALTGTGSAAAKAALSPSPLIFISSVKVGTSSAAKPIILSNAGGSPLTVGVFTISGTNASDFTQTHTCTTTMAALTQCTVSIVFKPSAAGARSASVSVATSAGTVTAAISGTAVTPATTSKVTRVSKFKPALGSLSHNSLGDIGNPLPFGTRDAITSYLRPRGASNDFPFTPSPTQHNIPVSSDPLSNPRHRSSRASPRLPSRES